MHDYLKSLEKVTLSPLSVMPMRAKPKLRVRSLLYLIKSAKARKRVFKASETTSLPREQAAAIGTGLQYIVLKPF